MSTIISRIAFFWKNQSLDWLFVVLSLCVISYIVYSSYTHPASRVPDYSSTISYIDYFYNSLGGDRSGESEGESEGDSEGDLGGYVKGGFLPPYDHCWVCHHPPLYYWLGAKAKEFGMDLRLLSLILSIITILVVYVLLRLFTYGNNYWDKYIVLFLTLCYGLWPYSIIFSGRIHNDVLFNLLFLTSLLFFVLFVLFVNFGKGRHRFWGFFYFICACLFTFLCVLTKSTGLILVFVGFISLVYASYFELREPSKLSGLSGLSGLRLHLGLRGYLRLFSTFLVRALLLILILLSPIYINFVLRGVEYSYNDLGDFSTLSSLLLGNAGIVEERFWVGRGIVNFLWFDLPGFFFSPVMLATVEESGRQYFLNHFLKTSLFGTFNDYIDSEIGYALNRYLAYGMSFFLLVILGIVGYSFKVVGRKCFEPRVVLILCAGFMLFISLVLFRYFIPTPHHGDFRLVYPILPILLCILCMALTKPRGKVFRSFSLGVLGLFLSMSFIYSLPLSSLSSKIFGGLGDVVSFDYTKFSSPKPNGAHWNEAGNHIFLRNQVLRVNFNSLSDSFPDTLPDTLSDTLPKPYPYTRLCISSDHNDHYVVIVNYRDKTREVFIKPPDFEQGGLSGAGFELDSGRGGVDYVLVYPMVFEAELGLIDRDDEKDEGDVLGDEHYSLGHLILIN